MPLDPATRLGPYEIVARLGAGGMGEVYRARDARLGRDVALKVLPAAVADDPSRRARFEQEARAAAALNHPNITAVHDVGFENGIAYLVTELIPGETIETLILSGPIATRKLLDIAVQVADGMAAAHAAHITHRDLKPANIMLTADGRVKILDFGLAKQAPLPTAADETMVMQHTEPGMILGTAAYMSPEQARGKPVDYRSDQFSFGLVLYEMAAGKKAFEKPETVQTMSAILTEEPPPIQRALPEPLRWAIDRCLAKEPADRYESTRDLFQDLRHIRDHLSETTSKLNAPAIPKPRRRIPWQPIAAIVGLAAAFVAGRFFGGASFPDLASYKLTPFAFSPGGQSVPFFSPDGKAVAYAGSTGALGADPFQIFVRYLDAAAPAQITHFAEPAEPIGWAPDSKRILFESSHAPGGVWSVSTVGGEPESVLSLSGAFLVAPSPDLRAIAVFRKGDDGLYGLYISSPPGTPMQKYPSGAFATRAIFNEMRLRFAPDGKHLLLLLKGDRSLDESWLLPYPANASDPPRLVLTTLPHFGGTPRFSWMPDSRHLVVSMQPSVDAPSQLVMADIASEKRTVLTASSTGHSSLSVSPDGRKIVFTETTGDYDIVSLDLEHATLQTVIATNRNESMPSWAVQTPRFVYVTDRNGPMEIWLHEAGGSERPIVTARDFPPDSTQWLIGPALSPDGERVIYNRVERLGASHLWMSSISGGSPVPLTNDKAANEWGGSWSPDGAWFVYVAARNGSRDLLKVKTSGQAPPVLVKENVGGREVPVWSPAGDWIVNGNSLVSPDGSVTRELGEHHSLTYGFSSNGKLLYGIRDESDQEVLFSLDPMTLAERSIGGFSRDFRPNISFHPSIRLSLSPDGKSLLYNTGKFKSNLWMLEGFQ